MGHHLDAADHDGFGQFNVQLIRSHPVLCQAGLDALHHVQTDCVAAGVWLYIAGLADVQARKLFVAFPDIAPSMSPGTAASYSAAGWKAGDKTSWEQSLRARAQYGQNDYTRAP